MRPTVRLEIQWQAAAADALLRVDPGFAQALTSLLDNAADASAATGSDRVSLHVGCDADRVQITIDDEGRGLAEHLQHQVGKALFTTKSQGFGLGLVLSHAHLDRLQGEVSLARAARAVPAR